jgi:glycosyltransferase involved in cell wall biosynthesis
MPQVLADLPPNLHEVIVVDGGSTDGTVEAVRRHRPDARILSQEGRGKGDALRMGFRAATGDIVVMLDADCSMSPQEIPRFVAALAEGVNYVKGSRFLMGAGTADLTTIRRMGNRSITWMVNRLFDERFSDLCYGYNAFWTNVGPVLMPEGDGFEVETEMAIRASLAGLLISEVPSFELPRGDGASNLKVVRDGFRIMRMIIRCRLSPTFGRRTVPGRA